MNNFKNDDTWAKQKRDTILVPEYYEKYCKGRYLLIDESTVPTPVFWYLQRQAGIDTIISKDKRAIGIEEKIVRYPTYKGEPHTAYTLETRSCTVEGHERDGWMKTSRADFLLYCFETDDGSLDCHSIKMSALQTWFWQCLEGNWNMFPTHTMKNENKSETKIVNIELVKKHVGVKTELIQQC